MKSTLFSLLFLSQKAFSSGGEWTYDHMDEWSHVNSMCHALDESPIDIITASVVYDEEVCLPEFEWDIDFTKQTFKVNNNGHSIVLTPAVEVDRDLLAVDEVDDYMEFNNKTYETLTLNDEVIATFQNYFLPQDSEHDEWCLAQLHFHWGTDSESGSEHLVNGKQYPLEVHFVHYSCSHANIGLVLEQFPTAQNVTNMAEAGGDQHQLAVIGFFFEISEEDNPAFDVLFNDELVEGLNLPVTDDYDIVTGLDLSDIIPEDYATAGYYAYEGSLTTPPCTNIVRWHVMNAMGSISESQMEKFRTFMSTEQFGIAPNYREVQENINTVYACMEGPAEPEKDSTIQAIIWVYAAITLIMPIALGIFCFYQAKKERHLARDDEKDGKKPSHGGHH